MTKVGYIQTEEHKKKISEALKGHEVSKKTKDKIGEANRGENNYLFGKHHLEETKRKLSKANKGGKRTKETRKKMSEARIGWKSSKETRRRMSEASKRRIGEKGANWQGGITPKNLKIRNSIEYSLWRESVFTRDKFTCQKCDDDTGGNLRAHHIYNFADYPELRISIDNGITLCIDCHIEFHKIYGKKKNTREQLNEFLTK